MKLNKYKIIEHGILEPKYVIVCPERTYKDHCIWWKPNGLGYTDNIEEAGLYSKQQVDAICNQPYVDDFGVLKGK